MVDGKTDIEVGQYAATFFRRYSHKPNSKPTMIPTACSCSCIPLHRYSEIKEWEKLMRRIEAGEARIFRRHELDAALAKKVSHTINPWTSLKINYDCLGTMGRGKTPWTSEADRYLVCLTAQCGYGRWEALQKEMRRS